MSLPKLDSNPEARFALEAVREASLLAAALQDNLATEPFLSKRDQSPVTIADFAVQALVGHKLEGSYPADPLVAEEEASLLTTSEGRHLLGSIRRALADVIPGAPTADQVCGWINRGQGEPNQRFWTLDPIDGTKGFLRKAQFAVALGLLVDGVVTVGVLGCPNLSPGSVPEERGAGLLYLAIRNQGAWSTPLERYDFSPIHVSEISDASRARTIRSFESGHTNEAEFKEFVRGLETPLAPVLMDSQAKYALVASGHAEILARLISSSRIDYREKIWDHAAGSLLVEEAGGQVTDLDGKPLDFGKGRRLETNRGVLVSNGLLHQIAVDTLRQLSSSRA